MFLAQISLNLPRRKQPRNEIGLLVDNLEENHISMFIILDEYTPLLGVEMLVCWENVGACTGSKPPDQFYQRVHDVRPMQ